MYFQFFETKTTFEPEYLFLHFSSIATFENLFKNNFYARQVFTNALII